MKNIILRFTKQDTISSKLVSFWTGGWPSHVEFVLDIDKYLGSDIDTGVAIVDNEYYNQFNLVKEEYYKIEVTETQHDTILIFLKSQLGKKYDIIALIGNMFRRNWQQTDKWFCSELVAAAFESGNIPIINYKTNRVTPLDLLKSSALAICSKHDIF